MPTSYYDGNAIYHHLAENPHPQMLIPGASVWPLVYATNQSEPKAMVVVFQCKPGEKFFPSTASKRFVYRAAEIARRAGLPFRMMSYEEPAAGQDLLSVRVSDEKHRDVEILNMDQWKAVLGGFGIPLAGRISKPVNRAQSSAYHAWQRANLGNIRVVDLDLLLLTKSGKLDRVMELKRSSVPIEKWAPYSEDFVNFDVIGRVCGRAGLGFCLLFNNYNRTTGKDNLKQFRVFDYANGTFVGRPIMKNSTWFASRAKPSVGR